jgi:hypothetical protein
MSNVTMKYLDFLSNNKFPRSYYSSRNKPLKVLDFISSNNNKPRTYYKYSRNNKPLKVSERKANINIGTPHHVPLLTTVLVSIYLFIIYFIESAAQQSHHHHHRLPKTAYDNEWVQTTEASNKNARHVLQGRLSAAKSHLHKEAIRSAYIALAQHDAKTGELRGAMGYLLRATDYCTTRSQTAHISLLILELALHLESYAQVREYVTKVEHTLGGAATNTPTSTNTGSVEQVATKLKIASGLQQLAQGDYTAAARSLSTLITTTSPSSGWDWSAVSSPEDLCLYASLLSLATQDRATIMQLAEHPEALELVPAMREVLRQFGRANYKGCCESLFDAVNNTLLPFPDFYLSKHWTALTRRIREKCLIEYLKPYECVQLSTMAQQFPFPDLEDMLVDLIGKGLVPARLDCQRGILQKVPTERKPPNLKHLERRVLDDTYALLVRLACLENELCVYDESARSRRPAAASARDYDDETSSSETEDTPMLDVSELQAANPEDLY